jgi:hypothetical protein
MGHLDFDDDTIVEIDEDRATMLDAPRLCHEPHLSGLTCIAIEGSCCQEGEIVHTAMHKEVQVVWTHHEDALQVVNEGDFELSFYVGYGVGTVWRVNNGFRMLWRPGVFSARVA